MQDGICSNQIRLFMDRKKCTAVFVGMLAFGLLCLLELIGFGFIAKLIELVLLIAFIMQYDRIRCAAKGYSKR